MADEWETFLTEHGDDITSTVHDNMRREANLFDIEDGTHAGWCGDRLGILVVLTEEEAEGLVSEDWRAQHGVIVHPVFKEFFGRMIQASGVSRFPQATGVQGRGVEPLSFSVCPLTPQSGGATCGHRERVPG